MCHGAGVGVRRQLSGVGSFLTPGNQTQAIMLDNTCLYHLSDLEGIGIFSLKPQISRGCCALFYSFGVSDTQLQSKYIEAYS